MTCVIAVFLLSGGCGYGGQVVAFFMLVQGVPKKLPF